MKFSVGVAIVLLLLFITARPAAADDLAAALSTAPPLSGGGTTYNVPPDALPTSLLAGETLNLGEGATIAGPFSAAAGSETNVNGGSLSFFTSAGTVTLNSGQIGPAFQLQPGGLFTMYGGSTGLVGAVRQAEYRVYGGEVGGGLSLTGGKFSIYGGKALTILASQQSEINLVGGELGLGLSPVSDSVLNMSGGLLRGDVSFSSDSTWNLSGGVLEGSASVSTLNIICKLVLVGGAAIPGLVPNVPTLVTQRNLKLSGVLLDGSPFEFDMNSGFVPMGDRFGDSTVRVTLVPEPLGIALAACSVVTLLSRVKMRRRAPA